MLTPALIVFAAAALGGVVLALHVLRGRLAPWALSVVHALLGAAGLVLLLLAALRQPAASTLVASLVLFAVAALGGFFLAFLHARHKLPPNAVVAVHAGVAVVAFGLLVAAFAGA